MKPFLSKNFDSRIDHEIFVYIGVFHKLYENAKMSLLLENKKSSDKILPPVGIEPGPLIPSPALSFLH